MRVLLAIALALIATTARADPWTSDGQMTCAEWREVQAIMLQFGVCPELRRFCDDSPDERMCGAGGTLVIRQPAYWPMPALYCTDIHVLVCDDNAAVDCCYYPW